MSLVEQEGFSLIVWTMMIGILILNLSKMLVVRSRIAILKSLRKLRISSGMIQTENIRKSEGEDTLNLIYYMTEERFLDLRQVAILMQF